MLYKYVTNNNLEERQDYMYSEFGGQEFLYAYKESRTSYINSPEQCGGVFHDTRTELERLSKNIQDDDFDTSRGILDAYVKRFEVSKRLYTEYNESWKKTENASYEQLDLYILLSECCMVAYKLSNCMKYLSCVLKINDTLLSLAGRLTNSERKRLKEVLKCEVKECDDLIAFRLEDGS